MWQGLLLIGCCFQSVGICRAHRSRRDERTPLSGLQEPLADDVAAGGGRRGPGQPTSLSTRMRQKYCGGAAASSSAAASSVQPILRREDPRPPPTLGARRIFGGSAPVEQPLAVRPLGDPGVAPVPMGRPLAGGGEEPPAAASNPFAAMGSESVQPSAPAPEQRTLDPNLPAWAQRG